MVQLKKEVEKKFRLDGNKVEFISRVQALEAVFLYKKKETDTYFNVSGRDSLETKECLRVREADSYTEITYKPPTANHQMVQSHFAKKETNLTVQDGKEAMAMLELIGNTPLVTVYKEREAYKLGDCLIAIDSIKDAGVFVEIEIETTDENSGLTKINVLARQLGLDASHIETLPYRDIVLNNQVKD
jgi:adenylate cyclase class 2